MFQVEVTTSSPLVVTCQQVQSLNKDKVQVTWGQWTVNKNNLKLTERSKFPQEGHTKVHRYDGSPISMYYVMPWWQGPMPGNWQQYSVPVFGNLFHPRYVSFDSTCSGFSLARFHLWKSNTYKLGAFKQAFKNEFLRSCKIEWQRVA